MLSDNDALLPAALLKRLSKFEQGKVIDGVLLNNSLALLFALSLWIPPYICPLVYSHPANEQEGAGTTRVTNGAI